MQQITINEAVDIHVNHYSAIEAFLKLSIRLYPNIIFNKDINDNVELVVNGKSCLLIYSDGDLNFNFDNISIIPYSKILFQSLDLSRYILSYTELLTHSENEALDMIRCLFATSV